jgi:dihydroorotase
MERGLAGVPGLDDFAHVVTWLVREAAVDPFAVARATSYNPARFLGLKDRGEIAVGLRGDFSVVDFRSPEVTNRDRLRTKCGWSPYEGKAFPGRARWTVVRGEVLMDDFEMLR